jgi:acyl carrier protein
MRQDNLIRLQQVFRFALELSPTSDATGAQQGQPGWDSLGHVKLIAAIENAFGIEIDTGDALELTSFPKTRDWLEAHGY